jgi:hypothetical protein
LALVSALDQVWELVLVRASELASVRALASALVPVSELELVQASVSASVPVSELELVQVSA